MSTKAAQRAATREKLVATARELFAARGYAEVGTEEIVRAAGVTRGALYHQFADKRDLFRAVFETVDGEAVERAATRALTQTDPLAILHEGVLGWVEAAADPEVQRIVLLDAPAVLGWEEWRAFGERTALSFIVQTLEAAMEAGAIARQPVGILAHVVVGALDEAALYVAKAEDTAAAQAEAEAVLDRLITGFQAA
jgi:AcrR family transcriptional regulator